MGTLLKNHEPFWSHALQFFLKWEIFLTFIEEIKTHFVFSNIFLENPAIYEKMWKNCLAEKATADNTTYVITSCIPKATNTHPEYVTFICFPTQRLLQGSANC